MNNIIIFMDINSKKKFIINCKNSKNIEKIKLKKNFFKFKKMNLCLENLKLKINQNLQI
ncbi:hypothetical protein NDNC_0880 [Candidatus Nasuia deltocephalinicola]|nr:hypothetical protein NDNC_0880 [Candidatus Nasuia deltocephalinicola]